MNIFIRCPLVVVILYQLVFSSDRASAQVFTNLHSFAFDDGVGPVATLLLTGNTLYGTARKYGGGPTDGSGAVFRLNTDGSSFTNLHTFTGGTVGSMEGGNLNSSLILVSNTLYGTASFGGGSNFGCVFGINPDGTGLTNVYSFSASEFDTFPYTNSDGAYPQAGLVSSGGTLYGTAYEGGTVGWGTVFGVNANGGSFTNLHNFTFIDGQYPSASLTLSAGTLYGTTPDGGNGYGTLFKIGTNGLGYTNFYNFSAAPGYPYTNTDGANPLCNLVLSGDTLYGTAAGGGSAANGTVFKVNTDGSGFTRLHDFSATNNLGINSDGAYPQAGLFLSGNRLYGTASSGGRSGYGTAFSVDTNGNSFTTLHSFSTTNNLAGTNSDGAIPIGGLVMSGNVLYGTASAGGAAGYGTVFSLILPPSLSITLSGTNAILTWPTNVTAYNLQSTTNLVPPVNWTAVNGQYVVTNPLASQKKFFRLIHP